MARSTELEEARFTLHLDIDGRKQAALDDALGTIRRLTSVIIGQDEVEKHDVSLVVQVLIKERKGDNDETAVSS